MEEKKIKGVIHCHSENSRYDSTVSVKDLCKKAKELGYEAISLTDHGTLSGIDDFIEAAKANDIKPIPGVELYVKDNDDEPRKHLILVAADDLGYQGLCKIVTETNYHIDSYGYPLASKEMVRDFFGKESVYHGHVIATSACVGGVLASILSSPLENMREIEKLNKAIKKLSPISPEREQLILDKEKKWKEELDSLTEEKTQLQKLAKMPFKKKENALEKLRTKGDTKEYEKAAEILKNEKEASVKAAIQLESIKEDIAIKKSFLTNIRKEIKDINQAKEKIAEKNNQIEEIKSNIESPSYLFKKAKNEALEYDEIFGHNNFFIEIQYHGYMSDDGLIELEKSVMSKLAEIAKEVNIPISAATDAHMLDNSETSIRARELICALRWAKSKKIYTRRKGDEELYLKSEDELRAALGNVLNSEDVELAISNTYKICERCSCEFKNTSHYPKFSKLQEGETADSALRKMTLNGIKTRFPDGFPENYRKRMEYELSVISDMGYSDYFLIVQDFLAFGRKLGKLSDADLNLLRSQIKDMSLNELEDFVNTHQNCLGFAVGAGRGSAAGSLVAYLTGITNIIDPIKYDLLFERFLNKDRVSMPDVDSDLSPEIRDLLIEYCKKVYGVHTVANIMTKGYMAPKGAIRAAARIIGLEKNESTYYLQIADKLAKLIPSKPNVTFADCEEVLDNFLADKKTEAKWKEDAKIVLDQAKSIEGVFLNYGMHAAGVIIADGTPLENILPLMKNSLSDDMMVQCNMVQAEESHGLLKFDFLGLKNLKIVTLAIRKIYERQGKKIDVEHLPFKKEVFANIFAKGNTGSIFQFESPGMRSMLKSFKPDCFEDLVALVSLYRPGPMDFIPQYIESKFHPDKIQYLCPELKPILGKTYGCIVYQEQVMEIVQKLAGFSLSQADNVRRFMSKKKMDKLEHEREAFIHGDEKRGIDGCIKRGISDTVANKLFDQMIEFAKYAFNKSHAAAYAALSYITAYLKYYYPAEYMYAVLICTEDITKLTGILNDCKNMGLKILPPDINKSESDFSIENGMIRFGLNSVKGTKSAYTANILEDRSKNGEYLSFEDFLYRDLVDKSTMENLIQAGAFDYLYPNRTALMIAYKHGSEILDNLNRQKENLKRNAEKIEIDPENKRAQTGYRTAKENIQTFENMFKIFRVTPTPEDKKQRLLNEKEVLGFFVSEHPMSIYRRPETVGAISINNLEAKEESVDVMGIITNTKYANRKSDGKQMAFFDLEDLTGTIHVCCFTKAFEKYGFLIEDNSTVKITGTIHTETNEENNEENLVLYMESAKTIKPDEKDIAIFIRDSGDWNLTLNRLKEDALLMSEGHPLLVYDMLNGEFRRSAFYISSDILSSEKYITELR